jgi:hypothetical protein
MLAVSLTVALLSAVAIYPFAPLAMSWLAVAVPATLSGWFLYTALDVRSRFALPLFQAKA